MLAKILALTATALIATTAFGADDPDIVKSYELKDGLTVHVYKDGKMAMEDKGGRGRSMKDGHIMETTDGQKIMMKGNELWRVEAVHEFHRR